LLEVPAERKGSVALQHQDYLYKFLDILNRLERASPEASGPTNSNVDEETELRLWADLRDHQLKFQVCMMTLKLEERTQAMVATVHAILNLIL
jgi:hypothetical protein